MIRFFGSTDGTASFMPFRKRNGEPDRSPTAYAAGVPLSAAVGRHFPRPTGEFTPKAWFFILVVPKGLERPVKKTVQCTVFRGRRDSERKRSRRQWH